MSESLEVPPLSESARATLYKLARMFAAGERCEVRLELHDGGLRRWHVGSTLDGAQLVRQMRGENEKALAAPELRG